jgi:hypothetical protein
VHAAAVEEVVSSHSLVEIGSSWFSSYCLVNSSLRPFRESRAVDCTLALILVLGTNVKEINLGFSLEFPLDITVKILNMPWRLLKPRTPCPFEKWKSLHIEGRHRIQDILNISNLRSPACLLQLRHCQIEHVFLHPSGVIQQLELCNVTVTPMIVDLLVSSPGACNLRQLKLRQLRTGPVLGWDSTRTGGLPLL